MSEEINQDQPEVHPDAPLFVPPHWEPQCRICRNEQLRGRINHMLATGSSYATILRSIAHDNAELDPRDQITKNSISHHSRHHFPVQNAAQATYREILERRAAEHQVDFENGVATALTPYAYLDVLMQKGFATLVHNDTVVEYRDGATAAARLHDWTKEDSGATGNAEIIARQGRIISAMLDLVPQELHQGILARIEGTESRPAITPSVPGDDDVYDPLSDADEDDD